MLAPGGGSWAVVMGNWSSSVILRAPSFEGSPPNEGRKQGLGPRSVVRFVTYSDQPDVVKGAYDVSLEDFCGLVSWTNPSVLIYGCPMVVHVRGVFLPDEEERDAWVVAGRLTFERPPASTRSETIASAGWVLPGFVDAHCHVGISPQGT